LGYLEESGVMQDCGPLPKIGVWHDYELHKGANVQHHSKYSSS